MADYNDRRHIGRVITCRNCDKVCRNREDLYRHLRQCHHNKGGYDCRQCNYSSTKSSNLRRHIHHVHEGLHSRGRSRSPQSPRRTPRPTTIRLPSEKQSSPVSISVDCSPISTSPPLTGKPLAMMLHELSSVEPDPGSSSDEDGSPPPALPKPTVDDSTSNQIPGTESSPELDDRHDNGKTDENACEKKILVSIVEQKTIEYFSGNICIKRFETTHTYPVYVPADWNKSVPCNYGMKD